MVSKKWTISTFSHTKAYATKFDLDVNWVKVKPVIIWINDDGPHRPLYPYLLQG